MTAALAPDPRRRSTPRSGLRLPRLHPRLTPPLGGVTASRYSVRRNGPPPRAAIA